MSRIGILYCIDSLSRAGTELQLTGLIQRLDRAEFQPHLCTLRPTDPDLLPRDCPHLQLNLPKLGSVQALKGFGHLVWYLRKREISVVQTFFQDATLFAAPVAWVAQVPVRLGSFRDLGFWRDGKQENMLRRVYPILSGFIANSQAVQDYVVQMDGLEPGQITVIPNGIEPEGYPWVDHTEPTLDVGIVGNLNREVKRTDLFLEAAGLVTRQGQEVTWHVIGDGHLRPQLENQARDLGMADRVVFAGRVKEISNYLGQLSIGVICSDSEGFSNALVEYMLRGCAVVATDVGGNREAIQDGESGLLVPPGDSDALAAALLSLLTDSDLRRRLAGKAREVAVARYGWDRCVNAHQDLYSSLLTGTGHSVQDLEKKAGEGKPRDV